MYPVDFTSLNAVDTRPMSLFNYHLLNSLMKRSTLTILETCKRINDSKPNTSLLWCKTLFSLNPRQKETKAMRPRVSNAKNTPGNQSLGPNSTIYMLGDPRQVT